jgi:hypothetical protein
MHSSLLTSATAKAAEDSRRSACSGCTPAAVCPALGRRVWQQGHEGEGQVQRLVRQEHHLQGTEIANSPSDTKSTRNKGREIVDNCEMRSIQRGGCVTDRTHNLVNYSCQSCTYTESRAQQCNTRATCMFPSPSRSNISASTGSWPSSPTAGRQARRRCSHSSNAVTYQGKRVHT